MMKKSFDEIISNIKFGYRFELILNLALVVVMFIIVLCCRYDTLELEDLNDFLINMAIVSIASATIYVTNELKNVNRSGNVKRNQVMKVLSVCVLFLCLLAIIFTFSLSVVNLLSREVPIKQGVVISFFCITLIVCVGLICLLMAIPALENKYVKSRITNDGSMTAPTY